MAARPYFTGNYGSALAKVDTRPIIEAGRAQGQMYANLGAQVGGMIQQYGLNKQKRAKLTGDIEAHYKENPEALSQIGTSGDEAQDKKDYTEREKFLKNDMSIAQLEGLAGRLARGEVLRSKKLQDDTRRILNETNTFNLGLKEDMREFQINLAKDQSTISRLAANLAEEIDPQKRKFISAELTEQIADLGMRPKERKEREMQLRDAAAVRAADPASIQARDARKSRGLQIGQAEAMEEEFPARERAKLERVEKKVGIEGKRKYIDYLSRSINPTIPGNVDIGKEVSAVTKEIDAILKSSSLERDDEGEPLTIEDLIEDVSLSGKITFSADANKISQREKKRLEDLLGKKLELQGQAQTTWIDDNGELRTGTIAEYEEILRKQEEVDLEEARLREQKTNAPFVSDAPEGTPSNVQMTYGNPFPL